MPEVRHVYGLATVQADDMVNSQRLAHTDVDFQWGTITDPKGLATADRLTTKHNKTGTAFYREKATGISPQHPSRNGGHVGLRHPRA